MDKNKIENRTQNNTTQHLLINGHEVTIRFAETEVPETFWRIREILLNSVPLDPAESELDIAG